MATYEDTRGLWRLGAVLLLSLLGACELGEIGDTSDEPPTIDSRTGEPVPADDGDLQYILHNGFGGLPFAERCVSRLDGGPTIDVEPLPVGDGRYLECFTKSGIEQHTLMVQSENRDPATGETVAWCALGRMTSATPAEGPPGLDVAIVDRPAGAPWRIVATHAGVDTIGVSRASFSGIAVWPIHFGVSYATTAMARVRPEDVDCEALFGL